MIQKIYNGIGIVLLGVSCGIVSWMFWKNGEIAAVVALGFIVVSIVINRMRMKS